MNERLLAVYRRAYPTIAELAARFENVSWPLLVNVPDAYSKCAVKLLVVGQETRGWGRRGVPKDVEDIVAYYREFDLGAKYRKTPFWQAVHQLHLLLNPDGPPGAFLWSNLIKVSQHKKRPVTELADAVCALGLLQHEIEITQPDVVVFVTGPRYDRRLRAAFRPEAKVEQVSKLVACVRHRLMARAFRTSHPKYLRLSGNLDSVFDEIAGLAARTAETTLLSEAALAADWDRPEEDQA